MAKILNDKQIEKKIEDIYSVLVNYPPKEFELLTKNLLKDLILKEYGKKK